MSSVSNLIAQLKQPTVTKDSLKGRGWLLILSSLPIFFIAQFIAVLLLAIITSIRSIDANSALSDFLYVLLAEGLLVVLVWRVLRSAGLNFTNIGLGRRPRWSDLKWATAGFTAFYVFWIIIGVIVSVLAPDWQVDQHQNVGFTSLVSSFDWILAFIGLVIIPPLGEEILVRGFLYTGLRSKLKFLPAMLITSALFGLAHVQSGHGFFNVWGATLDTFVLSLVLVYLREKTGALYACVAVHILNNFVAFIVHFHS